MSEFKIDVQSLDNIDAFDLSEFLRSEEPGSEIRYLMLVQESAHGRDRLLEILLTYGPQVGSAILAGTLGALKSKIKEWLLKKKECKHRKIPIYGPDGQVVTVVECESKHPEE